MTIEQFGQSIKAKHPEYKDMQDADLGNKMLTKYPEYKDMISAPDPKGIFGQIAGGLKTVGNLLTSSEQAFGNTLGTAMSVIDPVTNKTRNETLASQNSQTDNYLKMASAEKDPTRKKNLLNAAMKSASTEGIDIFNNPEYQKTAGQILGEGAGVALDVLSAGSYGNAAKGAQTGTLLVKGGGVAENVATKLGVATTQKVVAPVASNIAQKTLGQTVKTIATKTAERATVGAGTGYAYDVSQNLQDGKTGGEAFKPGMGAVLGGTIPILIGGVKVGVAITKNTAPSFINSLVKPKKADFSYGKNPGRTISEMGITGNSLDDFANNINTAKKEVGQQLGDIYASPANANIKINANDEITKIDSAIAEAAKGGRGNQSIVTNLQNTKDALLYDHAVNADGVIEKVNNTPRDLSKLSPQEAFDLKTLIAKQTKFTGNPSDDKTVNAVLKSMYSGLKKRLNDSLGVNNPEIVDLNQKYADLTSGELATRNRDAIVKRADMVGLKTGGAGALGTAAALISGAANIPAVLMGVGVASLEKAMETTAVKTRIASWLGKTAPFAVTRVLQQNPAIKEVLYRLLPKLSSKIGK